MIKTFSSFILLLALPLWVRAVEPAVLGNNLSYVRVHSLIDSAADLRSKLSAKQAFVLDLRYVVANDESIGALKAALAAHPAEAALFILISPATSTGVIDALTIKSGTLVTLGIAGTQPSPQIEVKTEAEADRRAYDAFDNGTPLDVLISGKIEKDRYDEATLVHEFKNGNPEPEPPLSPDPTKPKTSSSPDKPADVTAAPLKDLVLQRALNLYQALQALRQ